MFFFEKTNRKSFQKESLSAGKQKVQKIIGPRAKNLRALQARKECYYCICVWAFILFLFLMALSHFVLFSLCPPCFRLALKLFFLALRLALLLAFRSVLAFAAFCFALFSFCCLLATFCIISLLHFFLLFCVLQRFNSQRRKKKHVYTSGQYIHIPLLNRRFARGEEHKIHFLRFDTEKFSRCFFLRFRTLRRRNTFAPQNTLLTDPCLSDQA